MTQNRLNPCDSSDTHLSTVETPQDAKKPCSIRSQKGITLVEMLVVIFIIGLVGAIAIQNIAPEQQKAIQRKTLTDIRTIEAALEQYQLDMFAYPNTDQGLAALRTVPSDATRAANYRPGGYLRNLPNDPWGRPYVYRFPGERSIFDIYSLGADGEPGGEGQNADIGNWSET
ncbi:MAG: type II secretion system major pseudopilin GspG [Pseudomonadota bacterium]